MAKVVRLTAYLGTLALLLSCSSVPAPAEDASGRPAPQASTNATFPTDVPAPPQPVVLVTYYGQRRPLAQLERERNGQLSCHDAAGPGMLTCFNTEAEVMADIQRWNAARTATPDAR